MMKAFIFDLDGTLVDTVHAQVMAWQKAMCEFGVDVDAMEIHRRIGMRGSLLMRECARAVGHSPSSDEFAGMDALHSSIFEQIAPSPRPLTGAKSLLGQLKSAGIRAGIATSGKRRDIAMSLAALGDTQHLVIVDGDGVQQAKPEPDVLVQCQARLGVPSAECYVVGDSVWDVLAARRAGFLTLGLLCGGASEDDLYRACAFRVYSGPEHLRVSLAELGV
jgi:HAD superfamily hydrolase (TIGR01509 family)